MEYLRTNASAIYPLEELFRIFLKNSKKTTLKKSYFNNDGDSRPETLLKHNLTMLKQVIYVAYMLKIISLTRTPHSHEF